MTLSSIFKFTNQKGFSFISMALLIAFMSIGAAMVISLTAPISNTGSADLTLKKMEQIQNAISVYKSQHSSNPPNSLDDLVSRTGPACSADNNTNSATYRTLQGWCGPYLDKEFTNSSEFKQDGWGTAFQYDKINIRSCGANQTCGDGDDISLAI